MAGMAVSVDVCIRGAGIVGRTLALLLARERLRVALVAPARAQPSTSGHGDVRAYALNAAARGVLQGLRCWPEGDAATPVLEMSVHGDISGHLQFSADEQAVDALNWIVDVPALEARLADAVRFQSGIEEVAEPVPAALTVVCEGRASSTRAELGVEFDVLHYPQHAIATRLTCERPHGQVARQWFTDGEILAFLPLGGPQGNSVAVVWSVLKTRVDSLMALSPDEFAAQLDEASRGELGALQLCAPRATWALQLARAARWVGPMPGRSDQSFALAGDAAHSMHPLAGQGLNMGLADAAELAQQLGARPYWRSVGDLKLLRRYERARRADVAAMSLATDGLQQLFSGPGQALAALRNWGMNGFDRSGPIKSWLVRRAMGA